MSKYEKIIRRFDSPDLFLNHVEQASINTSGCMGRQETSNSDSEGRSWAETASFREALELARTGNAEVAKKIKPKDIELSNHGRLTCTSYDTSGDFVDIGRYLSGEPECMGSTRRQGKPIINILVNTGMIAHITANSVEARGKAILQIMSGLESNGYGVEITLVMPRTNGAHSMDNYHQTYVKVKSSREYFDLPKLAFWLTSPSVNRRLNFRLLESETYEIQRNIGSGYAVTSDLDQELLDSMPDCIYFPKIRDNSGGYNTAIEQIVEKYKA